MHFENLKTVQVLAFTVLRRLERREREIMRWLIHFKSVPDVVMTSPFMSIFKLTYELSE